MVRHFLILENSETEFSVDPWNGRRNNTTRSSLVNQVVADWLESIGGLKLVKYVGQQYAKELETCSLYDLQETLGQQDIMQAILDKMNDTELATLNRTQVLQPVAAETVRRKAFCDCKAEVLLLQGVGKW